MAKRTADSTRSTTPDAIIGYVHNISEVKNSKNNNRYFEGTFQTKEKMQRMVVFSADQHAKYQSAANLGSPIKLNNAVLTPNRSEIEIHCNRKTELEINQQPLNFKRKLVFNNAATDDKDTELITFKQPFETGTIKIKVIGFYGEQEIIDLGWGTKKKKTAIVADKTGTLEIGLWEDLIDQIESGKSYKITNVSARKYQSQLKLTTTTRSKITEIDEITDPSIDLTCMQNVIKHVTVQQCQLIKSFRCSSCTKTFSLEEDQSSIIQCVLCHMKQKREKLEANHFVRLNLQEKDSNLTSKMVIFFPKLLEFFNSINEKLDIDAIEEYFLNKEKFIVESLRNSDIITKIQKDF